jgi:hypothetical protein
MIKAGKAEAGTDGSNCVLFPSFEILENAYFYPTLGERDYLWDHKTLDFNHFENQHIIFPEEVQDVQTLQHKYEDELSKSENKLCRDAYKELKALKDGWTVKNNA